MCQLWPPLARVSSTRCDRLYRAQHRRVRFFFFQAEDGIRDVAVTGVQTCALPIYTRQASRTSRGMERGTVSNENCDLLTVEEVAKLLRVPTSWVYEKSSARTQERLPHVKLGK